MAPRTQKKELIWNVYIEDYNSRCIETRNIFDHAGFRDDVKKEAKKCKDDRDSFEQAVKSNLMYYFWSKCEWEIILTGWVRREEFKEEKIDVYDQVMLNWGVFIDYLWENRRSL